MLKINKCITPSPDQFYTVIKGMRLPFKSGDKSDSFIISDPDDCRCEYNCSVCPNHGSVEIDGYFCWARISDNYDPFVLGRNDKKLLLNLCKAGDPSHRKVLRQLSVTLEITAPLYWHKQMDQYKVGTVTQSESTMHTITKYPFKLEDFSLDYHKKVANENDADYYEEYKNENLFLVDEDNEKRYWSGGLWENEVNTITLKDFIEDRFIGLLNALRNGYLKTNDPKYWYAINELLPQSYNQTRCWSGNYENLVTILKQRKGHKLSEWEQFRTYVLDNVPYLKEINEAVNGTR